MIKYAIDLTAKFRAAKVENTFLFMWYYDYDRLEQAQRILKRLNKNFENAKLSWNAPTVSKKLIYDSLRPQPKCDNMEEYGKPLGAPVCYPKIVFSLIHS